MHPITVLNRITARSVRAVYWRCLGGESCPCPLLLCKADIVSTGKWPAPAAVPPETCNQATGQFWGLWGCISKQQGTTYLLFLHSWIFIHIFNHMRGFAKRLFLHRKTALICWLLVGAESLPYSPVMFESVFMARVLVLCVRKNTDVNNPNPEYPHLLFN